MVVLDNTYSVGTACAMTVQNVKERIYLRYSHVNLYELNTNAVVTHNSMNLSNHIISRFILPHPTHRLSLRDSIEVVPLQVCSQMKPGIMQFSQPNDSHLSNFHQFIIR
jgi:hypothetical protein